MHKAKLKILVKVHSKEIIDDIQKNGTLWMNPIDTFQKIENKIKRDKNENLTTLLQAKKSRIKIDGVEFELVPDSQVGLYIPKEDKYKFSHIFCMAGFYSDTELRADMKIFDASLLKHGNTILVIHNVGEFIKRLKKSIDIIKWKNPNIKLSTDRVEYINENTYHGEMGPFKKFSSYKHEQEWRIGISGVTGLTSPFILKLGSIEDISGQVKVCDFKNDITKEDDSIVLNF